jgi:hypothetical protein
MSRPRRRVCLQEGLYLDLNDLARGGLIQRGMRTDPRKIRWTHPHEGEIASGFVGADMRGPLEGRLNIWIGEEFSQLITLVGHPRRFGGRQWYFVCPLTKRPVSVVWKPDGAEQFCCRQAWGSQVAYLSQFGSPVDRAHLGKARIAASFDTSNPQDSELPRKPKWMRSSTYDRHVRKYNNYEAVLQDRCAALAPRSWREG